MNASDPPTLPKRRLLVDPRVQGSLLRRFAFYASACGVYGLIVLLLSEYLENPREPVVASLLRSMDEIVFWLPGLLLLAPIFAYDFVRFSNRFVGPMLCLRRNFRILANGENAAFMELNEEDFWFDAAESFNRIREELIALRESESQRTSNDEGVSETTSEVSLPSKDDNVNEVE